MTDVVTDPYTRLQLIELSHVWGHGVPSEPGQLDVRMVRAVKHAQHGVLAWRVITSLHTGTHMNAPIHMVQRGDDLAAVSPDRLFGTAAVLDIPRKSWEVVTASDLETATPAVQNGDIVVIVTGWHHNYSDGLEYFGEAPGLTRDAAEWLIEKDPKFVAVDTPFIDVPLATSMGPHRGGPQMKRLAIEYTAATGRDAKEDFPDWFPAHKALAAAGIPTVEQVGGDVDLVKGKRATVAATPWKFEHGDACPVRMIAMLDPSGSLRIDAGN